MKDYDGTAEIRESNYRRDHDVKTIKDPSGWYNSPLLSYHILLLRAWPSDTHKYQKNSG
jgi:hypothetical protein